MSKATFRRYLRSAREIEFECSAIAGEPSSITLAQDRTFALLEQLGVGPNSVIGMYAAMNDEMPTARLAKTLEARGVQIAYPRLYGKDMQFLASTWSQLVVDRRGIPTPPEACPIVQKIDLAALIVPGLGFDRSGQRLGYGGGYYDRYLAERSALRSCLTIAICFHSQLVDELPHEPHDIIMDFIVTDRETVDLRRP